MDDELHSREETDEQIRREKLLNYSDMLPLLVAGSWLPGFGVVYLAWGRESSRLTMLAWLAVFSLHVAYRLYHHWAFKRKVSVGSADFDREYIEHIVSGVINGSLWGWVLPLFGPVDPDVRLLVLSLIFSFCGLGAMVAGFNPAGYGAYVVSALVPLQGHLLYAGGSYNYTVAAMVVVAVGVIFPIARKNYVATNSLIKLRTEKQLIAKELEVKNELLRAANEGKSRLISAASHDLRQPVYGLTLMFNKMIDRCRQHNRELPERCPVMRTETEVQEIELALQYLSQSLNNLLDLSRLEAGAISVERRPVSLSELFSRLNYEFAPQAIAKNVTLRIRHSDINVEADHSLLHSILSNLVANAISYTDAGGVLVAARKRGTMCRIYVIDQGAGIRSADVESRKIFDEYFRGAKEKKGSSSAGLGLAIAERFARSMGAGINVSSVEGRGSSFYIDLPVSRSSAEAKVAIMLPGGAAVQGFAGIRAMLVTATQHESDWILRLLEENDAVTSCCATLIEAYMWAKRMPTGILIIDLPGTQTVVPNQDWMLVSQLAGFSSTLQIVVLAGLGEGKASPPHPFGIENCRLVDKSSISPLKLKSILMRELRQRNGKAASVGSNHQKKFP